jgi:hypothetical protein
MRNSLAEESIEQRIQGVRCSVSRPFPSLRANLELLRA